MLRKILLISTLVLSGCVFNDRPKTEITVAPREPLNIPAPVQPSLDKSKAVKWKLEGSRVSTDRNSFIGFMEELVDYSKYNEKLREMLKKYQDYTDNPEQQKK